MATTEREALNPEALRDAFAPDAGSNLPALAGGAPVDALVIAQRVPVQRNVPRIMGRLKALAASAGEDWFYRFPVNTNEGRKWIEGPSIICADNVAREYGNCQIDTRAYDTGQSWMIYARFADHETGFSMTRPFQQHKSQATLKTKDHERAENIAFGIGVSKAIRNVITHSLDYLCAFAMDEAKRNLVERIGGKLDEWRERITGRLVELKVDPKRVERMLGRKMPDWLAPDVARVIAELQAIKDGMATIDETWPAVGDEPRRADFADKPADKPTKTAKRAAKDTKTTAPTPQDAGAGDGDGSAARSDAEGDAGRTAPGSAGVAAFEYFDAQGEPAAFADALAFAARLLADLDEAEKRNDAAAFKQLVENNADEAARAVAAIPATGSAWRLADTFALDFPTVPFAVPTKNDKPDFGTFTIRASELLRLFSGRKAIDAFMHVNTGTIANASAGQRSSLLLLAEQRRVATAPEGTDNA